MKAVKIFVFILSVILIPETANCQAGHRDYIEFSLFSTHNKQAEYLAKFGDVVYTNNLKLSGPDLGFSLNYKRRLYDNLFVKAGIGYMDFTVSKIEDKTEAGSILFTSNGRPINYPSYIAVLYASTKYHYYNLLFHFAVEKQFKLLRNLYLFSSLDYFHAYRISQKYFIPGVHGYYRTSDKGNFGDFFNIHFGISGEFGKLAIAPALIIPVYKSWNENTTYGGVLISGAGALIPGAGALISGAGVLNLVWAYNISHHSSIWNSISYTISDSHLSANQIKSDPETVCLRKICIMEIRYSRFAFRFNE